MQKMNSLAYSSDYFLEKIPSDKTNESQSVSFRYLDTLYQTTTVIITEVAHLTPPLLGIGFYYSFLKRFCLLER